MTIRKGEQWGETVESPSDLHVAPDDAAAREWVVRHRTAAHDVGQHGTQLGLGAGDLARTMGGGRPGRFPGTVTRACVDLLRVTAGDDTTWAVAHVVARRSWWTGEVLLAMNAQFLGPYDVAPRSHPNDGRVDVVRVDSAMSWRARAHARSRARTGSHLPHPQLHATSGPTHRAEFSRPLVVWVDGVRWRTASTIDITVEPDALFVYA